MLSIHEKIKMIEGLVDAETKGVQKYVEAIAKCQKYRQIFSDIIEEEFQHIRLLNEICEELHKKAMHHMDDEMHEDEEHSEDEMAEEEMVEEPAVEKSIRSQPTTVSFKRSK